MISYESIVSLSTEAIAMALEASATQLRALGRGLFDLLDL